MPAYFETGFSVRQPMWHGLGSVLDSHPENWEEARKAAGLEWEPMLLPVYARHPKTGAEIELASSRVVVRDDSFADLGVVSDEFELITHRRMGDIMEAILGQPNVKFETAGVIRGGKEVWALVYLDEPFKVAGDNTETLPFLAFLNAHHGQGAAHAIFTDVRVVCWNTYQAALARANEATAFTFRHTAGVNERIEEAKKAMAGLRAEAKAWQEACKELFGMRVDDPAFDTFLAEFLPDPPPDAYRDKQDGDALLDRARERMAKSREVFRNLYGGPTVAPHAGTALGLVDASVEFLDYVRPGTTQGRVRRSLLRAGDTGTRKQEAIALARRVAR